MPARSGDWTSDLKRVSRSGGLGPLAAGVARRAAKVTSSTRHLGLRRLRRVARLAFGRAAVR